MLTSAPALRSVASPARNSTSTRPANILEAVVAEFIALYGKKAVCRTAGEYADGAGHPTLTVPVDANAGANSRRKRGHQYVGRPDALAANTPARP